MKTLPLLVELRTEELPPLLLGRLADDFAAAVHAGLVDAGLAAVGSGDGTGVESPFDPAPLDEVAAGMLAAGHHAWATPRRLVAVVHAVRDRSPQTTVVHRGPAKKISYGADGEPSKALQGFVSSKEALGENLRLREVEHNGETYVAAEVTIPERALDEQVGAVVGQAIEGIEAPRMMRWGAGALRFVRPIHGVLIVHGDRGVEANVLGWRSGGATVGHRFLSPEPLEVASVEGYAKQLAGREVIVDPLDRWNDICEQARKLADGVEMDEDLLEETAAMCERPSCHLGSFDEGFLELPEEVVACCMKKHLRCFPVYNGDKMAARFVFVADNRPADTTQMVRGVERVMRARLDDALFIYKQDLQLSEEDLLGNLESISYIKGLGSVRQRCERISRIAEQIAEHLELDEAQRETVKASALLCKAGIGTQVVDEYPELEGVMAALYLRDQPLDVCDLIADYLNRELDRKDNRLKLDSVPKDYWLKLDCLVLAHEAERLVSVAVMHKTPTGSGDPHGLRRSVARCVRILVRKKKLDFDSLLKIALEAGREDAEDLATARKNFDEKGEDAFHGIKKMAIDRILNQSADLLDLGRPPEKQILIAALNSLLIDYQDNFSSEPFVGTGRILRHGDFRNYIKYRKPLNVADLVKRINAVEDFKRDHRDEYETWLTFAIRLRGIGSKFRPKKKKTSEEEFRKKDPKQNSIPKPEKVLADIVSKFEKSDNYLKELQDLEDLATAVDNFLDQVLVDDDDNPEQSANRIALVQEAFGIAIRIADARSLAE